MIVSFRVIFTINSTRFEIFVKIVLVFNNQVNQIHA